MITVYLNVELYEETFRFIKFYSCWIYIYCKAYLIVSQKLLNRKK